MTHIFSVTMPNTLAEFEALLADHNIVYPDSPLKEIRMQKDVDKYKGMDIRISHKMNSKGQEELSHYTVNFGPVDYDESDNPE